MAIAIRLSPSETYMASAIGAARQLESEINGRANQHGCSGGLALHVLGAAGEIAFCKAANRFWGGSVNSFKGADVGVNVQVRTRSKHEWDLIVRQNDKESDVFVLVTGDIPNFLVHGWILGRKAKDAHFAASHGDRERAFFVPKHCLTRLKNDASVCAESFNEA